MKNNTWFYIGTQCEGYCNNTELRTKPGVHTVYGLLSAKDAEKIESKTNSWLCPFDNLRQLFEGVHYLQEQGEKVIWMK